MSSSFIRAFPFSLICVASLAAWTRPTQAKQFEADLKVHVLVYNYAPISNQTLVEAQERAAQIFLYVGVEVVWVANTLLQRGSATLKEIDLILRVLPQPRASLASRTALGEALRCDSSQEGCTASVFYSRARKQAELSGCSLKYVLGVAMAHELGHLLLGSNSHSARGLMQGKWRPEELRRATKGDLLFSLQEAEVIRANVLQRVTTSHLPIESLSLGGEGGFSTVPRRSRPRT
jgi:hypothetical protein